MKPHLYIHQPSAIFKARVNITEAISYPISAIPFDNVTLGDYTDIQPDSTILLGTTEGADDLGRVRAKHLSEEGQVNIPRTAKGVEDGLLVLQDEAYITVLDDYRVWGKIPYFDLENGVDYKDGNIEVGTSNTEIPPVANCGPGFAGYIDPDTELITVFFDASFSFPVADGATIVSYDWDVKDGTIIDGTSSDSQITATFPAGFRWVAMTVVDSNDKPHTARCPVLAVDPDDDVTVQGYTLRQNLEKEGQTLDIELFPHLSRDSYLDGTLVMFWIDEASSPSDRSHMKFIGWLDTEQESIRRDREGLIRGTTLKALDICGKLDKLPGFSQALYREEEEDEEENPALPWGYMPSLDMHKCLVYLLFWHSTALELGDFILPSGLKDYDTMRLDSGAGTLFQQVQQQAQKIVPDHYLTCNTKGQMQVQRDWMLDDVGDRPIASPIVTESGWNGLSFDYNRHPRYHSLRSGSILVSTDWVDDGEGNDTLPLVFSVAPGDSAAFSQGASEAVESEGLTLSQEDLNTAEGHRFARMNSRFGNFSFSDPTASGFWEYEPAEFKRVQLNIGADYATKRGLSFTQMVGQVQSISVTYGATREGSRVQVNVNFEKEIEGFPALTTHPDDTVEDWPVVPAPPAPPDMGLVEGQELVAGVSNFFLYRTFDFQTPSSSGGPTWDVVDVLPSDPFTGEVIHSFVVDPFSPGYLGTGSSINCYLATNKRIVKVNDIFGTPSLDSLHTFAHETLTSTNTSRRTIGASFGEFFEEDADNPWLMVVSHYRDKSGHTGTWAIYSQDAGQTWSDEVQITSHYASGTETITREPALYLSPKTPGLAYALAYKETGTNPTADAYYTTDWGANWSPLSDPDVNPGVRISTDIHVPWPDNDNETLVYHGHFSLSGSNRLHRLKRVTGTTIEDISPQHSGINYGPYYPHFSIRTYDSDRNYVVMGGVGSDGTGIGNVGVWVSDDGGDTWTNVIAPFSFNSGTVPNGLHAAFSGTNPDVLYFWGGASSGSRCVGYSSDFGATIDDRIGNLASLVDGDYGDIHFLGIAGGPSA